MAPKAMLTAKRVNDLSEPEVARLKLLIQRFSRNFGLLVTKQTPCGLPISPSHAHCLMVLLEREQAGAETSQSDLGEQLHIDKSNIARLCSKLERDGHATQTRSPTDGRGRIVTLTLKGRRMAGRLENASSERFRSILSSVPADDRGPMLASLETLVNAVGTLDGRS